MIFFQIIVEDKGDKTAVWYDDTKKYPMAFGVIPDDNIGMNDVFNYELNQGKFMHLVKKEIVVSKIGEEPIKWLGEHWPQLFGVKPNVQKVKNLEALKKLLKK